ncbi:MAG: hypothetical protein K8S99_13435 [Planctomycetes bacterium]|nr:hypothetical protein [Planctomycetota bacterium]
MNKMMTLCVVLVAVAVGGCSNKITGDSVRGDMSPELGGLASTREQSKTTHAHSMDTTGRQFWDDVDKFLLIDRPLRLSRYPVP